MAWRNCKASTVLVDEINRRWPGRDKTSDGTIGDAAHATRTSDHNPWIVVDKVGVVRARDVDKDGIDAPWLAEWLRRRGEAGDPRLTGGGYVIFNRRITTQDWRGWKTYTGSNPHTSHLHVSFSRLPAGFDSTAPWGLATAPTTTAPARPAPTPEDDVTPEQDAMLRAIHLQLTHAWPGWGGGTGEALTLVDYARRGNVEVRQVHGNLASLHQKLDAIAKGAIGGTATTADQVRALIREALADLGPLHLTAKETL